MSSTEEDTSAPESPWPSPTLRGQLALVTGSSRGIGAGIAIALAKAGAGVIIHGKEREAQAQHVARTCRELGTHASAYCADLRDEAAVTKLFEDIRASSGVPSILVINAGTAYEGLLTDMHVDEWDDLAAVHLRGAFLCARAALPAMARARYGRIIVISSIWGQVGAAGEVAYATVKGGLIAFTKSLAKEWGTAGITVNAVAPGAIETDMLGSYSEDDLGDIKSRTPVGRLGAPRDVGTAVAFLASPKAAHITGQVLTVDGGWSLQ